METGNPPTSGTPGKSISKSSTGIEENIAALLAYAFGFISGIVFIILEKDSTFVRFHAVQSTVVFAAAFLINFVAGFIPFLNLIVYVVLVPATVILWILLMVKAYQGQRFKLPIAGDVAEKNSALPGK